VTLSQLDVPIKWMCKFHCCRLLSWKCDTVPKFHSPQVNAGVARCSEEQHCAVWQSILDSYLLFFKCLS